MHALFPGSFDPPHRGHLDVIVRAAALCSQLTVAVAVHPDKQPFLPVEQRVALLRELTAGTRNVTVDHYRGQTAGFALARGCDTLLRGVRDGLDLGYERGMAAVNREVGGIDTIFIIASPAVGHLSSALVRTAFAAGLSVEALVPPAVARALAVR